MADKDKGINWGDIAGPVGGLIGTGLGMIGQRSAENRAHGRQKELMGIQFQNQQSLNQQGSDLQYDMWNKTNAAAQKEHYKKAGLNPGMMYGGSGAGGTTTGSQGGGSAASGNSGGPMDIGNSLQAGMMTAQIANINADTRLKDKDAGKSESITDMNVEQLNNLQADYALKIQQAKTEEEKQKWINKQAEVAAALKLKTEADTVLSGKQGEEIDAKIDYLGKQGEMIDSNILKNEFENKLIEANTGLSEAKIKEVSVRLAQGWKKLENDTRGLDQKDKDIKIKKYEAMIEADYPGAGKMLGNFFMDIKKKILGTKDYKAENIRYDWK